MSGSGSGLSASVREVEAESMSGVVASLIGAETVTGSDSVESGSLLESVVEAESGSGELKFVSAAGDDSDSGLELLVASTETGSAGSAAGLTGGVDGS